MSRIWTDNEVQRIADALIGTSLSIPAACEQLDIDEIEDPEARLLDVGVECCVECGWWHESYDMNEDAVCRECAATDESEGE